MNCSFNIREVPVGNQFILVQHEVDLPTEAGKEEDGLSPGSVHLVPVHRHGGQTTQPGIHKLDKEWISSPGGLFR